MNSALNLLQAPFPVSEYPIERQSDDNEATCQKFFVSVIVTHLALGRAMKLRAIDLNERPSADNPDVDAHPRECHLLHDRESRRAQTLTHHRLRPRVAAGPARTGAQAIGCWRITKNVSDRSRGKAERRPSGVQTGDGRFRIRPRNHLPQARGQ